MATAKKATKTKAAKPRKAAAAKRGAKLIEVVYPGFAPGGQVQVHFAHEVEVEASRRQRPFPKAVQRVKVAKDGGVKVAVNEPAVYALAVCVDEENDNWRYVKVPIRKGA